jgi:serine/threonine-protein kinase
MIGQTISHYEILEKLGRGGMGVVYKARDARLDRFVALKFLPPEFSGDAEANARFMQEARAASALEHPNICTIHDIGTTDDGRLFIVMPFYAGQTLKYRIQDGPLSVEESVDVGRQIARGLARAHDAGIVHRDIKPANIMVTDRGEVTILDFGVAKLEGSDFTKTGTTLGSVSYMSPEQTRGEPVDGRSDIWSLGVVLYEMLTGTKPFTGDYDQAIAYAILNKDPQLVSNADHDVPEHIVDIVQRLLRKDAVDRVQSASQVLDILGGDGILEAAQPQEPNHTEVRRWRIVVAAFALVGLTVLISYTLFGGQKENEPPTEAARLAVLPFSNMRSDPETDFLGYALADQVIGSLTYVQNLTVRPSSSVRKFQHGDYDLGAVAEDLAVDFVLAGNYLQQDDRMRLTVELIDLKNDQTLWREPIEISYQDAFEMQDLVAERLLTRLEISFSEDERDRMTADVSEDPLAYEYYLRSLSYEEDAAGNQLAVNMLRKSTELDSAFAPAWDALGRRAQLMAYWDLGGQSIQDQARKSFLRALDINPELLSALAHLSMLYTDSGETDLAMETALRALEINPNSAEGVFAYGYVLRYAGMHDESLIAMTRALQIDPTNPTFKSAGYALVIDGQFDEAVAAFQLGPSDVRLNWEGEIAIRRGRYEEARAKWSEVISSYPSGVARLSSTALLAALDGDHARGVEAARKWEDADLPDGEGWYYLAGMYCINGEIDKCISVLDTAVERGYFAYPHMLTCRFLDPARGNPQLEVVLEKARLKHEAFKAKFFAGSSDSAGS